MLTPSHIAKSSNGAQEKLKVSSDCRTMNVVYLMSCGECGKQYVGETKGQLSLRMNGHRDDWRHKRFERSPVAVPVARASLHESCLCLLLGPQFGLDGQDHKTA